MYSPNPFLFSELRQQHLAMKSFNLKHKLISLWVTWQVIGMVNLYRNASNKSGSAKCVLLKPFSDPFMTDNAARSPGHPESTARY